MFASKPLADRNSDPQPFVDQWGIDRSADGDPAGFDFDVEFALALRPEFQYGKLPANRILADIRTSFEREEHVDRPLIADWAAYTAKLSSLPLTHRSRGKYSPDEIEHARRVLHLLAVRS